MSSSIIQPKLFIALLASWVSVYLLFLMRVSDGVINDYSLILSIFTIILFYKNNLFGFILLPVIMLLGSVVSITTPMGALNYGDILSIVLIVIVIIHHGSRISHKQLIIYMFAIVIMLAGTALSSNPNAASIGLVRVLHYLLLAIISGIIIDSKHKLIKVLDYWLFYMVLVSIVMLWAYLNSWGSLLRYTTNEMNVDLVNITRIKYFYRVTYFYVNIWLSLGVVFIYAIYSMMLRIGKLNHTYFLYLGAAIIIGSAMVLNNAKSMLFPTGVAAMALIARGMIVKSRSNKIIILTGVFLTVGILAGLIKNYIVYEQQYYLLNRMISLGSLETRISVWENVLNKSFISIPKLLVGWGPQMTFRSADLNFFKQGVRGNVEGAIDSGLLTIIIEYGILLFALVLLVFSNKVWRAFIIWIKTKDDLHFFSLLILLTVFTVHVTQVFSIAPPALVVIQIFAIVNKLRFNDG